MACPPRMEPAATRTQMVGFCPHVQPDFGWFRGGGGAVRAADHLCAALPGALAPAGQGMQALYRESPVAARTAGFGSRDRRRSLRPHRGGLVSMVASASEVNSGESREQRLMKGLVLSLEYERTTGYQNYLGEKGVFAEFVAQLLSSVSTTLGPKHRSTCARLRFEFSERYGPGSIDDRRQMIRDASFLAESVRRAAQQRGSDADNAPAPNVSWLEIPCSALYRHDRFTALQETDDPQGENVDMRLVRQRTDRWFLERTKFQITASCAWQALGFGERLAAKRLGIPASSAYIGHFHAIEVFSRARGILVTRDDEDIREVYLEWGARHEARAQLELLVHNPLLHMFEAGLFELNDQIVQRVLGRRFDSLPTLAASPDALMMFYDHGRGAWTNESVCEVKCRSPYLWTGSKWILPGRIRAHKEVLPSHFAQIQLQMLCCGGLGSGNLVSNSIHGTNVFHVPRNDEWLQLALHYLSRGSEEFIQAGKSPPENFFFEEPEYQR